MQSNNPVFRRSEEFSRSPYGNSQPAFQGYAPPQGQGYDEYGRPLQPPAPPRGAGRMTIDTVVQTTAITLGVIMLTAAATWLLTPSFDDPDAIGVVGAFAMVGALTAFGLSLVNSFKRQVSPALVLAFAAAEGVALGAISKVYDAAFPSGDFGGIVVHAVLGTVAAFAGTLAAYKVFDIQVGNKFRTIVTACMFGMVALGLLEFGLSFFGAQLGLFGFGTLGLLFAVAGLVLGVFMLVMDFDFVERGIANGLPERESWRASFALAVSLVWIYTNLLRILAILQQD